MKNNCVVRISRHHGHALPGFILLVILSLYSDIFAQNPMRAGTSTASYLEIGFGAAGSALGDAYASSVNDASAIYWNPAGLAEMEYSEAMVVTQPWIANISANFTAIGLVLPRVGTLGLGLIHVNYGEMEVTTMAMQDGTGEMFTPTDLAFSLSYARKIVNWFAFGASAKYVSSRIWHTNAHALAFDLGMIINTHFLSPTSRQENGLKIGMSISNYGTPLKYEGIDLINPIDISQSEAGNYRDVPGQFRLQSWELPLIFRIGATITPLVTENHVITCMIDALHPNNNTESLNLGGQYTFRIPSFGQFCVRGGYKALFMKDSQYGPAFGFGIMTSRLFNRGIKFEYAFRDLGLLGNSTSYSLSMLF